MKERDQWASKIGFILAAAGSAVGLGNIWKFPGKAYAGGGGIYLLAYIIIVFCIGFPVMVTELSLGRFTQKNTLGTFRQLDKRFTWVGFVGVLCPFVILCYYGHVGGYVLRYVASYITTPTAVMDGGVNYFYYLIGYNAADGTTFFPWTALIFAAVYMALNCFILVKGVSGGIEKINKVGMPALFAILLVLLVRVTTLEGAADGFKYMLSFDMSKFNAEMLLSALGQAFYSLSLGMAIMITYGSYLGKQENISKSAGIICSLDTLVAFIAGFIIVPSVFATLGSNFVGKGATFAFGALSGVFKAMPAGRFFGMLFYILLLFAAISSSISIEEGIISFICEEFHTRRTPTTIILTIVCYLIGVIYTITLASVSINIPWIDFNGVTMMCAADWMECFTDRLLLPLCALGECIFAGWFWKTSNVKKEIEASGHEFKIYRIYSFLIKFICPAAIVVILAYSLIAGVTIS